VDIGRAVVVYEDLDWEGFVQRVCDFEVRIPVFFGLRFATEVLNTQVPERVMAALRPSALRSRMVRGMVAPQRTLGTVGYSLPGHVHHLLHLCLVDGLAGVVRAARFLLMPGDEWLRLRYSLPESREVHRARLWHPFRVLGRALALLVRASRQRTGGRPAVGERAG
jgi:hypothetical protein